MCFTVYTFTVLWYFFEGDETASQSKRSRRALLPEPEEPRQDTHLEIPAVPEMMDLLPPQADVSTREDRMSPEKPRADISLGVSDIFNAGFSNGCLYYSTFLILFLNLGCYWQD